MIRDIKRIRVEVRITFYVFKIKVATGALTLRKPFGTVAPVGLLPFLRSNTDEA